MIWLRTCRASGRGGGPAPPLERGAGALRPLNDGFPEPHEGSAQVWLRDHAQAPWVLDCLLTQDRDGLWTSARDPDHVVPLDDVTWVAGDGIRYMRPEIMLHYKAGLHRPKDDRDLAVAWPLLGAAEQDWLREAVRRLCPDHPWLERLGVSQAARAQASACALSSFVERPSSRRTSPRSRPTSVKRAGPEACARGPTATCLAARGGEVVAHQRRQLVVQGGSRV